MVKGNGFIFRVSTILLLLIFSSSGTVRSQSAAAYNDQVAVPESSKKWKSQVPYDERAAYEQMLKLKQSFQASLSFLPSSFQPQNSQYTVDVAKISIIFLAIGGVILLLIFIFLILRFCCKKCMGPIKASQITRTYRNFTWFVMILQSSEKMQTTYAVNLKDLADTVKKSPKLPQFDEENLNVLYNGLVDYNNKTSTRTEDAQAWENKRSLIAILIFVFYLIVFILSLVAFFRRWPSFLLGLSLVLLFSLPALLFFEGITASYYFIYSDLCQSVHDAMYENKFPIADRGLGYFINCFPAQTKAALYAYTYEMSELEYQLKAQISSNSTSSAALTSYLELQKQVQIVQTNTTTPLIGCDHVYSTVEYFEERFCVSGMKWANYLLTSYSWLVLIIFLFAYAVNRMKPLVEKKKSELESMIINEDAIY